MKKSTPPLRRRRKLVETINGKKEIVSLNIKPEAVDPEDVEILQDMIIGAVNEAIRKVEEIHSAEMEKITNGLSLPGIF